MGAESDYDVGYEDGYEAAAGRAQELTIEFQDVLADVLNCWVLTCKALNLELIDEESVRVYERALAALRWTA